MQSVIENNQVPDIDTGVAEIDSDCDDDCYLLSEDSESEDESDAALDSDNPVNSGRSDLLLRRNRPLKRFDKLFQLFA